MKKLVGMLVVVGLVMATGCATLRTQEDGGRSTSEEMSRPTGDVPATWQVIHVIAFEHGEFESRVIWQKPTAGMGKIRVMYAKGFYFWPGGAEPGLYLVRPDVETTLRLIPAKE